MPKKLRPSADLIARIHRVLTHKGWVPMGYSGGIYNDGIFRSPCGDFVLKIATGRAGGWVDFIRWAKDYTGEGREHLPSVRYLRTVEAFRKDLVEWDGMDVAIERGAVTVCIMERLTSLNDAECADPKTAGPVTLALQKMAQRARYYGRYGENVRARALLRVKLACEAATGLYWDDAHLGNWMARLGRSGMPRTLVIIDPIAGA